ncbi:MAG TPA: di-heme oxidoredictase family protein [Candidatus Eisenbacteria bacterium]|nr:di-heme oxidoredictase family protein [Candidatus Eisenbacteria bacterium]
MARTLAVLGLGLIVSAHAGAQTIEVPAFPVGAPTFADHLQDVDVAAAPDGGFTVVWGDYQLNNLSGGGDHATVRRFSAAGVPLAAAVRADTTAHVFDPHIALDGRGGYAAAWLWIGNQQYRYFGQTLGAGGEPTGSDFEITLDIAGYPSTNGPVVGTPDGPIFLWDQNGMWGRRLDSERHRRGGDIRVADNMYKTDVDVLPGGGFVATWEEFFGVAPSMGRLFGPTGQPRGPAFVASDSFHYPRVAVNPRGGFVVVGQGFDAGAQAAQVVARRFAGDGTPLGAEIVVEPGAPGVSVDPDVVFDDHGNFLVVWAQYSQSSALPPRGRAFDVDGVALGPAIDLGPAGSAEIRSARLGGGGIVNVWYWSSRATGSIVRICTPGLATCGDGVRVAACEECDDGVANGNAPGGCRADCRRARCGDGVVDAGEACDDGNTTSCDGCSAACAVEPGIACGDGVRNQACGEECDDGAANGNTPDGCRTDCRLAHCGDGVVDADEQCDDGNDTACDGCDADCLVEPVPPAVCAPVPMATASAADLARFEHGRHEFAETENVATGLGPVFNGVRCAECHATPTVGGSSARNVVRVGAGIGATYDSLEGVGGPVIQERGIVTPTCAVAGEVVPAEATAVTARNTPPLFGLGFIEAIPEISIRLQRERQRPPLSGRFNTNRATRRIGRFGWKAQIATIQDFAAEAYRDELGITSPFAPAENAPQGVPTTCDGAPEVEDDGNDVAAFTDFMTLLAPAPKPLPTLEARRGRRFFRRCKCQGCHTDKYRTSRVYPVPALRNLKVPLFSDLLVHDMGAALADGIEQEGASGSEFRTAPLWGLRFSAPYLHDGRAPTLEDAILAHGGEAQDSILRFLALDPASRSFLVAYLNSL